MTRQDAWAVFRAQLFQGPDSVFYPDLSYGNALIFQIVST